MLVRSWGPNKRDAGMRKQGSGFRVPGLGFRFRVEVWGFRLRVLRILAHHRQLLYAAQAMRRRRLFGEDVRSA